MNYSKYFVIFIINFIIAILILYKITQSALKWVDVYTKHGSYVVVPNLKGFTLPQSISILEKLKLKYNIDTSHYDPNFKINQIISFSPEAGDHVKEGRHIYIQVNFKLYQSVLPNIINKNKRIAIKLLHANHISVKEIKYINDLNKDTVLKVLYKKKSIQFGYRFPPNQDGITLIIGKGYEKNNLVVVPNVIGMSLRSAIYTLKNQLFDVINFYYNPVIINPNQNAKVYRQKPDPGVIYDKKKSIELWLTSKELLDHLIQIEEKDSKNQNPKIQIEEKDSKNQNPKIQIEEKDSKNQNPKIQIEEKDSKNQTENKTK
ncbi:PASTA domain-containing protein [Blattabacterium sp. (Nauphoeta cinerea)]|uniref:PASTA domain-containing protein n=1 Tax=Blattabacterium sp. (Nauphoeta cinerea) TaxID=1316444 RepID=UPI000687E483|nr:PASTA domain-containing protein [Blattabacterium sp. (Nauphoeta cinerea)]